MSLTGIWTNELRSRMLIRERPDFGVDGIYQSIVGRDSGFRTLVGRTSKVDGTKQMVAWVVCFEIADPADGYGHHSVCGWSGWGERDDVSELIETHWLLTINIYDKKSNWSATHVGEDTFLKINDDADEKLFRDMDAIRKLYAEKVAKVREKQS